jgi:hypothetical protein
MEKQLLTFEGLALKTVQCSRDRSFKTNQNIFDRPY